MGIPEISVIIPVYNVEKYLAKCFDSIIAQTFSNIEIIIINDCSTDNSEVICIEYAKRDSRIIYIKNEKNLGLGLTRNIGINLAKAKYLSFIDSDDFLDLNCYEFCIGKLSKYEYDYIAFGSREINADYSITKNSWTDKYAKNILSDEVIENETIFKLNLEQKGIRIFASVCSKIIKKSTIIDNNIKFFDIIYEDTTFSFDLHYYAQKILLIPECFYNYYKRESSLSRSISNKHIDSMFFILNYYKYFMIGKNIYYKYKDVFLKIEFLRFSRWILGSIVALGNDNNMKQLFLNKLKEENYLDELLDVLSPQELKDMFNYMGTLNSLDYWQNQSSMLETSRDYWKNRTTVVEASRDYWKNRTSVVEVSRDYWKNRTNNLENNKWYLFSQLNIKGKIVFIFKVFFNRIIFWKN